MSKNHDDAADIEQAKRNATVAKARMQTTVGALKQRLNPKTIAADAAENVKGRTAAIGDAARKRPAAASAAAGLAALIVFRKPVGKLVRGLFSRKAKAERRERKEAKQVEKDWRRAEKDKKREEKELARRARRVMRDPDERERVSRAQREQTVEAPVQPQDTTILQTAATRTAAVPAEQE